MSDKIMKILEMVKEGVISLEEGNELIAAVKGAEERVSTKKGKMFYVDVLSSDGDKVNVKLPLNLARIFLKGGNMKIGDLNLGDMNIDLNMVEELLDKELVGDLVKVESADGDNVHIYIQ